MAKRDFYEVMGIGKGADDAEIKKAYRKLARELHPDANPDDPQATERFKEVKEAYDILSDQQKRAQYDQFGHAAFDQQAGFGGAQQGGYGDYGASPFGDIFESFFGGMGGGRRHTGPERGADLRYDLDITFEEAYFGVEKEIEIARIEGCPTCGGSGAKPGTQTSTCKVCNGTGQVQASQRTPLGNFVSVRPCEHCHGSGKIISTPCSECKGQGKVRRRRRIKVRIPAGVDIGSRLRVSGEGEAGERGGPPGDLFVFISVLLHKQFSRKGNDIIYEMPISFVQAALGDEVEVPTLDGEISLKIPEGTETGTLFRIRGKGFPSLQGYGRGDLHVRVAIQTPKRLNEKQKAALMEFAKAMGDEGRGKHGKGILGKMKDAFNVP